MRRLIIGILFALLSAAISAQPAAVGKPVSVAPSYLMPASKIAAKYDPKTFMRKRLGYGTVRVRVQCARGSTCADGQSVYPTPTTQRGGTFRITCGLSHAAFDDPIVWPGRPGMTHPHVFFGNQSTGAASDLLNMAFSGNSSCSGGILNRSGYWSPDYVFDKPGDPRNGNQLFPIDVNAYYKSDALYTVVQLAAMRWLPPGLRMISGSPNNTEGGAIPGAFVCDQSGMHFDHAPSTADVTALGGFARCSTVTVIVAFRQCWDGVNLDAPDHASHMKSSNFYVGCDDPAYPVLTPSISFNIHFRMTSLADFDYWRLSSDQPRATATGTCATAGYNYCAGASLHADWVNGWSTRTDVFPNSTRSITDAILDFCLRPKGGDSFGDIPAGNPNGYGYDCHDNLIGYPDTANPTNSYLLY